MFGAVQSGKKEAVRFFHAWKAQVASASVNPCYANDVKFTSDCNPGDEGGASRQIACLAGERRLGTPLPGARYQNSKGI